MSEAAWRRCRPPSPPSFIASAFRLPPSAYCLLPTAYCLLASSFNLRRVTQVWKGTDDLPASDVDGFPGITLNDFRYGVEHAIPMSGLSMYEVSENIYDHGGVGDGDLTETRAYYGDAAYYATAYGYDSRHRLTDVRGPDGVATKYTLDNLGEATRVDTYADADADFVIDTTGSGGELRARTDYAYDDRGQVYRTTVTNVGSPSGGNVYAGSVTPGNGQIGHQLTTNTFYNNRGQAVKVVRPNGLFTKTAYDGAGRSVMSYLGYDATGGDAEGGSDWTGAQSVDGDTIIQQNRTIYDGAGNVVTNASYERFESDTTTTGELGAASNKAFIQVGVSWYDLAGRPVESANYGRDNGGTRYVFNSDGALIDADGDGIPDEAEGTPPLANSSDDYIVDKVEYDDAGRASKRTDNLGHVAWTFYDSLGRRTRLVENGGTSAASLTVQETDTDGRRTTEWHYDASGRLAYMRAENPAGSGNGVQHQDTRYLYESPFDASWATSTIYPDSGDTTSSGTDQVKTAYDRLGRVVQTTDQRQVVHNYDFDAAGRLGFDRVTLTAATAATNVASAILGVGRTYDDAGRVASVYSYAGTTSASAPVNGVDYTYDGWGNVASAFQGSDAGVGTVNYSYDDGLPANSTNTAALYLRLDTVTYPGGRTVTYNYGTATGTAGLSVSNGYYLSRPDGVSSAGAGISGTHQYARYSYVGASRLIRNFHPDNSGYGPNVGYDTGGAGAYDRLDRFGRVLSQLWQNDSLAGDSYDGYLYTYDRGGNVTSRNNYATGQPTGGLGLDNTYAYDGLDRLATFRRGTISGGTISGTNQSYIQDWTNGGGTSMAGLDALGNWTNVNNNGTTQTRTTDAANELTGISGGGYVTPTYDAAGNMVSGPSANNPGTRLWFAYDAWGRMTDVYNDNSGVRGTLLAHYGYDGLGRRIEKTTGGHTDVTYYNENWQRVEVDRDGDSDPREQFIWDAAYIDTPVVRFFDGNSDGDFADTTPSTVPGASAPDSILYYLTDANQNVTALFDPSSHHVVERYVYDPYGLVTVYDRTWSTMLTSSAYANDTQFGAYVYDGETGLSYARSRYYDAPLATWVSRDAGGYIDGANLYQYVESSPIRLVDPYGMAPATQPVNPWVVGGSDFAVKSSLILRFLL